LALLLIGCAAVAAGAALLVQALLPATYEARVLLKIGRDIGPDPFAAGRDVPPQQVQAIAQTINTQEAALEAAAVGSQGFTPTEWLQRCKAKQNQDTALITLTCRAPAATQSAQMARAMAAAAITLGDRRFAAQQAQMTAAYDLERKRLEGELSAQTDRIAVLRRQGSGDPELQNVVNRIAEIRRQLDQLFAAQVELPLRRNTAMTVVADATIPERRAPPTPVQVALAAAIAGLAIGFELVLLLRRPRPASG
jgi:capsular polysaccharide biosynthesis protein